MICNGFGFVFEKLKKAVFIDFSDRDILELFVSDIKSFSELYVGDNDYLFIDEFQRVRLVVQEHLLEPFFVHEDSEVFGLSSD